MSAFTPYRRVNDDGVCDIKTMLQMYTAAVYRFGAVPLVSLKQEAEEEVDAEDKGSKFLIKNILKDDTEKKEDVRDVSAEQASRLEGLVSSLGKSEAGHRCLYCGKIYSRKYGLKIHIRTHTGYKPLKCKFCQRPFGDPSNLNKHVRLHSQGTTPYRCDECGKILVRKRDLDRHILSRHQQTSDPEPENTAMSIP